MDSSVPADKPRHLLVVDDNRDHADALCELLDLISDWHSEAAYAVSEAVAQAHVHVPDAVLLDLEMPPSSGFAVADALQEAFEPLPVLLAVSGNSMLLQSASRDKRFARVILKPADPEKLVDCLGQLVPLAP